MVRDKENICEFQFKFSNIIVFIIFAKEDEYMEFDPIIKRIRSELDLSQKQIRKKLNISFSAMNQQKNGKSKPSQMDKELFSLLA